jgi:hypothetical protein
MVFSRDECIAAVRDYYQFLAKMFMDESNIMEPPPGGWPNITPRALRVLNKTEEVVSLLRHLPYIDDSKDIHRPQGIPLTSFANWTSIADDLLNGATAWGVLLGSEGNQEGFGRPGNECIIECDVPSRFVGLTFGYRDNDFLVLDTASGRIYWPDCSYKIQGVSPLPSELEISEAETLIVDETAFTTHSEHGNAPDEEDYNSASSETPPTSDDGEQDSSGDDNDNDNQNHNGENAGNGDHDTDSETESFLELHPSWPVVEFFEMLKSHFCQFNFVVENRWRVDEAWGCREGELPLLRNIYRKHGWPDLEVYQKEACLAEVARTLREKYPEDYSDDDWSE